jgi:hypothetical protein
MAEADLREESARCESVFLVGLIVAAGTLMGSEQQEGAPKEKK